MYGQVTNLLNSADTIPVAGSGQVSGDKHRWFLDNRRTQQRQWAQKDLGQSKIAICKSSQTMAPSSCNVLLGRGSGYVKHVGNVRYRGMIQDLKEKHDMSNNAGKKKTCKYNIKVIHDLGGRFLKYKGGVWIHVDDEVAFQKVAHSFRALRSAPSSVEPKTMKPSAGAKPTMKRMARD